MARSHYGLSEDSPFLIGPGTRTGFAPPLSYSTGGHTTYTMRRARRRRRSARMPHANHPPTRFTY